MPRKKTVPSSITSMGFPLLQKPGEMCPGQTDRRVWKIPRLSSRKKQKFSRGFRGVSALETEVTESAKFYIRGATAWRHLPAANPYHTS
jgi:hypothetical protein